MKNHGASGLEETSRNSAFAGACAQYLAPHHFSGVKRLGAVLSLSLASVGTTLATTGTWIATGDGTYSTANTANWANGYVPGVSTVSNNGDVALFNLTPTTGGAGAGFATVTLSGTRSLNSIDFDTSAGSYTLSGGTEYYIESGGGINLESTATSTGQTETISTPVVMGGSFGVSNNATTADVFTIGNITGPAATHPLSLGGTNTGANAINGTIANGAVPLAVGKSGAGSWILAGTNTYTGGTSLSAGVLMINGTGNGTTSSGAGTSTVAASGTGVLGGNGLIIGTLSVSSGATLAPGTGVVASGSAATPGILTTGAVTLNTGSNFNVLLTENSSTTGAGAGTAYSQISAGGTVTLGGSLNLTLGSALTAGDKFYILLNSGTNTTSGTFSNISGTTFADDGYTFTINYADNGDSGGVSNDVSLVVDSIPEPGTWMGAMLGIVIVSFACRRNRTVRAA